VGGINDQLEVTQYAARIVIVMTEEGSDPIRRSSSRRRSQSLATASTARDVGIPCR
jgi:hypothetical protein